MFSLAIRDKNGTIVDEGTFEEGEILVGRSQAADVVLPSDNVSRRHVRIYTVEGRCYVEDLNSSNGVFVNGRRIHEAHEVVGRAELKVGDYYIVIEGAVEDGVYCRLQGQNLSFEGETIEVEERVTLVGRGKECGLTIIDGSISRAHAKLTVDPSGAIILEDLNSSNGTFVNGEQIRVRTVEDGATIRFGNAEFIISMPDPGTRNAPARWSGTPRRSRGPWVVISIAVVLLAAGAVVFAVFADDIFGTSSSSSDGSDDPPKPELACDPVKQARCGEDETCSYLDDAEEPSCQPTVGKKIGASCGSDKDCAKGICVSMGALEGAEVGEDKKVCHTFCNTSAQCPRSSCKQVKKRPFKVCEFDKNSRKIQELLRAGGKQIKARDWTSAKATYKKILELDAIDVRGNNVQAILNKIEIAEEHKAELNKAKLEIQSGQPTQIGDAARRLRRIKKAAALKQQSVYTPEAVSMLRSLKKERKQLLVVQGKSAAKKKRCPSILKALACYDAALAIDPTDAAVRKRRDAMRAKKTKKDCR